MKRSAIGLAAVVALIAVALFYVVRQTAPVPLEPTPDGPPSDQAPVASESIKTPPPAEAEATPARPSSASAAGAAEPKPRYARLTVPPGQPIPELNPFQAERDHLLNLAATQDPRQVATISASLSHANPTVRETARQALLQLGDASAAPALVAAAASAKSPEEAALLSEAAEFLSLPKFMDVIGNPNPPDSGLAPPPAP